MPFTKPKAAQIDFDVTNISDPLICLNYGQSGTPDDDVGLVIERGSSTNVALIWDESADLFALINTTETGTTAGNVSIASYAGLTLGQLSLADSAKIYLGTSNDLELYHNGNNSFISDQGNGGLYILTNDLQLKNAANDELLLRAGQNADVELYYDNAIKLQTASGGISVTGAITATGTDTSALLTLTTTEASSSASPIIALKRNSGSPADSDQVGQIQFLGENDADEEVEYGRITTHIDDASNGSEDGTMQVKLMKNGTLSKAVRFEPDGIFLNTGNTIIYEGATADNYETTLTVVDPTADRTVSLPNATGTLALTTQTNLTTKGDLEVYTSSATRLAVGTNDYVLTADSSEASGLAWKTGGGGVYAGLSDSTTAKAPGDGENYDLAEGVDQDGDETPFVANDTADAFGVSLVPIYDCMEPAGSTKTIDYGSVA